MNPILISNGITLPKDALIDRSRYLNPILPARVRHGELLE
jgi:hypothetical protein